MGILAEQEEAAARREAERAWTRVAERHPKKHAKYIVRRDGFVHTATPCYGIHVPWWVPMSMVGRREQEPVAMLDTDEWQPLSK
mgnify:CR=1 FL=1